MCGRLIVGLADMRFVERKTSNPQRFKRLEVQEITDELSDSAYVKVSDASGKPLAEVIIGRPSARFFGGNSSGTYIRFPETTETLAGHQCDECSDASGSLAGPGHRIGDRQSGRTDHHW